MRRTAFRWILFGCIFALAATAQADWRWLNPLPQGNILGDVAYGNGTFVAVGNSGVIVTSSDGTNWTLEGSGTNEWLYAVTWVDTNEPGGGHFIAVGANRTILTSPDGKTWTTRVSGPYAFLYGVAAQAGAQNQLVVAVGSRGQTLYSINDGVTWQEGTVNWNGQPVQWLNDVVWAGTRFVAVGAQGAVVTSQDGVTWTAQAPLPPRSLESVDWNRPSSGSGVLVTVGSGGAIFTSVDAGVNWSPAQNNAGITLPLNGVHWDGTQFVAVGRSGNLGPAPILTSPDGVTWTDQSQNSPTNQDLESVASAGAGGALVAVGNFGVIIRSDNGGVTWAEATQGSRERMQSIALNNASRYVAVGRDSKVLTGNVPVGLPTTPPTEIDLSSLTGGGAGAGGPVTLHRVVWDAAASQFIAVGGHGSIVTSADGSTWSAETSNTLADLWGLAHLASVYMAVGTGGTAVCQRDGGPWAACSPPSAPDLFDVAANSSTFVVVGAGGVVLTTADGTTWNTVTSGTTSDLLAVTVDKSGGFIAAGADGTILTSPDGTTWTAGSTGEPGTLYDVIWNGSRYFAVGTQQTVRGDRGLLLTSVDGVNWSSQQATGNSLFGLAAADATTLTAGDGGTIMESTCPCATDDTASTNQGQPITIDVLANDIGGTGLRLVSVDPGSDAGGTVTLVDNSHVRYIPAAGFAGPDTFDYTITDDTGGTDVGTVTVNVAAVPGGATGGSDGGGGGAFSLMFLAGLLSLAAVGRRTKR